MMVRIAQPKQRSKEYMILETLCDTAHDLTEKHAVGIKWQVPPVLFQICDWEDDGSVFVQRLDGRPIQIRKQHNSNRSKRAITTPKVASGGVLAGTIKCRSDVAQRTRRDSNGGSPAWQTLLMIAARAFASDQRYNVAFAVSFWRAIVNGHG